jgi:sterol desaturase/sphingolipid hydroxylase (fatty acid hydroxylase superfamily)
MLIIFAAFIGLMGLTILDPLGRSQLRVKSREDWILDSAGLIVQGVIIPLLQVTVITWLYRILIPFPSGSLKVPPLIGFVLSFVIIDYLYYWNHRLLHSPLLWRVHRVHHTVTQMDVLGTSRNPLWASLLIIYLWIHTLFLYLLADPIGYLLGVSLTSALDLWRHSRFAVPVDSWLDLCLRSWLILPQDHAIHHGSHAPNCNYGANFKFWDRMHGTLDRDRDVLPSIGISTSLSSIQKLWFPFDRGCGKINSDTNSNN